MKVQQDSFEERSASPDLPEPLYEEVGDFGLQVLKSLETSFLSSSTVETQEVSDQLQLTLVPVETGVLDHLTVCDQQREHGSVEPVGHRGGSDGGGLDSVRMRQLQGVCTSSQELLLQELSSAFIKKTEEEQQETPSDTWFTVHTSSTTVLHWFSLKANSKVFGLRQTFFYQAVLQNVTLIYLRELLFLQIIYHFLCTLWIKDHIYNHSFVQNIVTQCLWDSLYSLYFDHVFFNFSFCYNYYITQNALPHLTNVMFQMSANHVIDLWCTHLLLVAINQNN